MVSIFSSNYDLFEFINSLIKKLQEADEEAWASKFTDAMMISFMPGELLGAIRLTLLNFQKTTLPRKLKLSNEVKEAVKALDKVLGYWRP